MAEMDRRIEGDVPVADLPAADMTVLVDWDQANDTERQWLVELSVASLGWGARFGKSFVPRFLLPSPADDALPSGVAMYATGLREEALPLAPGARVVVLGPPSTEVARLVDVALARGAALALRAFGAWTRDARTAANATMLTDATTLIAWAFDGVVPALPSLRVDFEPPPVAVVIPSHNRRQYITTAIASVLAQHYPHVEVVVADDGSTDGTPELVAAFADAGVRLFGKAHSGGPDTRNQVLQTITAPFVVWLGDDDVLTPDCVTSRLAMLARHPDADVIYGEMTICDADMAPTGAVKPREWYGQTDAFIAALFERNEMTDGGTLLRRDAILRAGGYNPAFPKAHDYEFWTRLAPHAVFKRDPHVGYYWRWHGRNMGVGSGVNPYQDAHVRIVLAMAERYAPAQLFPDVPWATLDDRTAEGVVAFRMALRLRKEAAHALALPYAERAVALVPGVETVSLRDALRAS